MIEVKSMKVEYFELNNRAAGRNILHECVYVEVVIGGGSVGNMSGIFDGFLTSNLAMTIFVLSISMFSSAVCISSSSTLSNVG